VSVRRVCKLLGIYRGVFYYQSRKKPDTALVHRLKELAASRPRYGYRRLNILLNREGWKVNHKRVYRHYVGEGLQLRQQKSNKRKVAARKKQTVKVTKANQLWGMDFVSDRLVNGRQFRVLTVIDLYSRECLALYAGKSIKGSDVRAALEQVEADRGVVPEGVVCDNARSLPLWNWISGHTTRKSNSASYAGKTDGKRLCREF